MLVAIGRVALVAQDAVADVHVDQVIHCAKGRLVDPLVELRDVAEVDREAEVAAPVPDCLGDLGRLSSGTDELPLVHIPVEALQGNRKHPRPGLLLSVLAELLERVDERLPGPGAVPLARIGPAWHCHQHGPQLIGLVNKALAYVQRLLALSLVEMRETHPTGQHRRLGGKDHLEPRRGEQSSCLRADSVIPDLGYLDR